MILAPIIAVDIGVKPAFVVVTGTKVLPILLGAFRFQHFDMRFIESIRAQQAKFPGAQVWIEEHFSGPKYLRDTGRKQADMATDLAGYVGLCYHVPPVNHLEAMMGWDMLGRPPEGEGEVGREVRDACGIAMKALSRSRKGDLFQYTTMGIRNLKQEERAAKRRRPARRAYR